MDIDKKKRGCGIRLDLERLTALDDSINKCNSARKSWTKFKTVETAKRFGIDRRTIERYAADPSKLEYQIKRLLLKQNNEVKWEYFAEGMRLLSTPIPDLVEYMKQYIRFLTEAPLFKKNGKLQQIGSIGTCYNKAMECFDTDFGARTIRERRKDNALVAKVKDNLKDWAPGTIGVHTVTLRWDLDHGKGSARDKGYNEMGGQRDIMLLVERKRGLERAVTLVPETAETTDTDRANEIAEFLLEINTPNKVVRLVTAKKGDRFVPTTIDKTVLQELLGDKATVEEDVPTKGIRDNFKVERGTASVFKVKGRFRSEEDLHKFLEKILNEGHRVTRGY